MKPSAFVGLVFGFSLGALVVTAPGCAHVHAWTSCMGHEVEWTPLVEEVAEDFATANYTDAVNITIARAGYPAVKCAVEAFLSKARANPFPTAKEAVKGERARAWLEAHRS